MSFPTSLDTFPVPTPTDPLSSPSHSDLHEQVGLAVEAVEAKLGLVASTPVAGAVLTGTGTGDSEWITPVGLFLPQRPIVVQEYQSYASRNTLNAPVQPSVSNICVMLFASRTTGIITSVVQTGMTWTKVTSSLVTSPDTEIWVGVPTGGAIAANVTINMSVTENNGVYIAELSGLTGTVDDSNEASSAANVGITGAVTTVSDGTLVCAILATTSTTTAFNDRFMLDTKYGAWVTPLVLMPLSTSGTFLSLAMVGLILVPGGVDVRMLNDVIGGNTAGNKTWAIAAIS